MRRLEKSDTTRSYEAVLKTTFGGLILIVLASILLGFASLSDYYDRVAALEVGVVRDGQGDVLISDSMVAEAAQERGMSTSGYALYQIVLSVGNTLILGALAGVVLWRARSDWFGWFTSCVILFLGSVSLSEATWVANLLPFWMLDLGLMLWVIYPLYFFLFPNGRAVPGRMKWLAMVFFVAQFVLQSLYYLGYFVPDLNPESLEAGLTASAIVFVLAYLLFDLACQVYRYRWASNAVEKQQAKWFVLGLAFLILTWPVVLARDFPFEPEFFLFSTAILPLTIGVAMLRYRLFDVDVIINRALVYGSLTLLLAGTYFGSVVSLQYVFRTLTGGDSRLAIVASTLVIAALFVPLRRRLQRFIDRRFYRSRYDARRVLDEFSKRLRDKTDLEELTGDFVSVVRQTVQPSHMRLWIRETRREKDV